MKITFVGLSSYLIEDSNGGRLLIDLFKDEPEYSLGLTLPKTLKADIFLASHADADHANLDEKYTEHFQKTDEKDNDIDVKIFPDLDLKGTLVREWNGDLCFAYHFTVDGFRCLHLADNSHPLTAKQIAEFGKIDILFIPMPKSRSDIIETELNILNALKPKIIIPSHFIPLPLEEVNKGYEHIHRKLAKIVLSKTKNPQANDKTVDVFTYMLLTVKNLTKHFSVKAIDGHDIEIKKLPKEQTIYYFNKCLSKY
ncbi:MAG TPA: MBL fold metallo-hydrolase [bacterium]|nr:MBL fold metallo-hydrolase [bacterium]HOH85684.1 MBL fold metallo-hydrolase [bacterium]